MLDRKHDDRQGDLTERNAAFAASGFDADLTINPSYSLSLSGGEFSATDQGVDGVLIHPMKTATLPLDNDDYPSRPGNAGVWLNSLVRKGIQRA